MVYTPKNGDDFPFDEELNDIFADMFAEESAAAEAYEEYLAESVANENRVMDALIATGDPFFTRVISVISTQRESDPTEIEPIHIMYTRYIGIHGEELAGKERKEFEAFKQALYTIAAIGAAVSPGMEDHKQKVQLEIIENDMLPVDGKIVALRVATDMIPGEGIDTNDADKVLIALGAAQQESEMAHKLREARRRIRQLLDEQTDFLELHHIHPDDPAWKELKATTGYLLSSMILDDHEMTEIVQQITVRDSLARLRVGQEDYQALQSRIEQLYRDRDNRDEA